MIEKPETSPTLQFLCLASGSSEGDDDGAHDDLADSDDSGDEDEEEPLENNEDDNESTESEGEVEGSHSDVIVEVPHDYFSEQSFQRQKILHVVV